MHDTGSMENKKNKGITGKLLQFAHNSGLIRASYPLLSKSLTVLNYHRINDPSAAHFDSFKPNVSATPEMFAKQMEYLSRWFNVVSVSEVVQWLQGKIKLPDYPALITFDDGYLDNYTLAYPILKQYNFPAVIFLTSGHIGTDKAFYWDLAAYCFFHTSQDHILFPDNKEKSWETKEQKFTITNSWVESLKRLPDTEKQKWVNELPSRLKVSVPKNYFKNLMMSWDQIREMSQNGFEFGGHTVTHPILSRIPIEQAQQEIIESKSYIEKELGQALLSFAYPNGTKNDFNPEIQSLVANAGYKVAFTLLNGPTSLNEVKKSPYTIRRIFILHSHTLAHYSALVSPINRYRK